MKIRGIGQVAGAHHDYIGQPRNPFLGPQEYRVVITVTATLDEVHMLQRLADMEGEIEFESTARRQYRREARDETPHDYSGDRIYSAPPALKTTPLLGDGKPVVLEAEFIDDEEKKR